MLDPPISLRRGSSENADRAGAMRIQVNTRSDETHGPEEKIIADISERLSHLDVSIAMNNSTPPFPYMGSKSSEPRTAAIAHGGSESRTQSNISDSQLTAGRDMNSYHVTGTFIQGTTSERDQEASASRRTQVDDEDDIIAAGMMIPAPSSCILERDTQQNQTVANLLSIDNARVAILGMGGIGKTTLACNVANDSQVVEAYSRRLFLSFEGCSTPDLAYTNLASAFHIPADQRTSHRQILSRVLNYLKQDKTLLIIDNFETFWEVSSNRRCAEDFLAQLATLHKLAMIVTLRGIQRPGNLRWFKIDPLQTLSPNASEELLSVITDEEYDECDSEYIHKLLSAVAGIPLAVTLIGTLLRDESESPESLWNQWTQESARAIRVANEADSDDRLYKLDISLRLSIFSPRVSDNARATLAAISIIPTGLSMDGEWLDEFQELLPSTVRIRDCIRTLRDVALVALDSTTSPHRLRLLPPVRDFCLDHLSLDNKITHSLINKYIIDVEFHANWVCSCCYAWVTTELSNITATLNHAINLQYITDNLGSVIYFYAEWRRFLCIPDINIIEHAIDILSDPKAKALCLQTLGATLSEFHGNHQEAIQTLEHALHIHREVGDTSNVQRDLSILGNVHRRLGDTAISERFLNEARDLDTGIHDEYNKGSTLRVLAETYIAQENLSQAESTAKEAIELCRASRNLQGEAAALEVLGRVYNAQEKYDLALEMGMAARDSAQAIHNTRDEGCADELLGLVYCQINKPNQAVIHYQSAASLFERSQCFGGLYRVQAALEELGASLDIAE